MNREHSGDGLMPEYRLSHDSARVVVDRTPPPRIEHRFLSTDHLSTEAAAAFVDGCLPAAGQVRAEAHLERCSQCRREVSDQRDARRALRGSGPIRMPGDLRERLSHLGDGFVPERAQAPRAGTGSSWSRLLRRLRGLGH